jgi:arylsulfatase A-like enzyme
MVRRTGLADALSTRGQKALAAALTFVVLGCGSATLPERPNIVLVVLCSFRLEHSSLAGYSRPTTPFLAELAASGVYFENAVSTSAWTKPATVSLITGLTPNVYNLWDGYPIEDTLKEGAAPNRILPDRAVTLAEVLRDAGYATAGRINNVNAGDFFNLTQGLDDVITRHRMTTPVILDELAEWLADRDRDRPFFFFLFTLDAHVPYKPDYESYLLFNRSPESVSEEQFPTYRRRVLRRTARRAEAGQRVPPHLRQRWIDLYDAGLALLDRNLARLPKILEEVGVASETVIVVTADHGEHFFEPGLEGALQISHGQDLTEALVHIPLVIRGPGIPAERRITHVVRSIDIFPTLAELAGAEPPPWLQGRSLVPLVLGKGKDLPELQAFSSLAGVLHTLRQGRYKTRHLGENRALYDIVADPHETRDLWQQEPAIARHLDRALDRWLAQEEELSRILSESESRELTPEMIEHLRSLGYL